MAVNYNYKKGVDLPAWQWLSFYPPGPSYGGSANVYDGKRYLYWCVQHGSTATTASTTMLYRYDTWSNGWQYLATATSGNRGIDIEYDSMRNVLYIIHGAALTSWQVFNLNTTAVTIANVSCAAWTLTTMTPVLPAAADYGASLSLPSDLDIAAQIDAGTADSTGNTTTTITATTATGTFGAGMVGLQMRVTSGAQSGQKRTIATITAPNVMTVAPALPGALANGDTFVIEAVEDIATAGTTTTLTDSTASWIVNSYTDHDVIITGGTGAGQRRRIASNTATVLTLASATTGNARTGAFTTAPDATSTFKIVPSSDFLYYHPGNGSTALYRIDVGQTTGIAWSASLATAPAAIGPGSNTFFPGAYSPGFLMALRGAGTAVVYMFNIALKTWSTLTTFAGSETFTTGSNSAMLHGKRKMLVQKESSQRLYALDLLTGIYEPFGMMPYAAPGAYDGKRARFVKTADGVEWLYIMRAGGQEFFRVPLEWV
jgi:hypothetical protein